MGKVYQIVREVVQGTLNRTPGPTVSSQATGSEDSLSEALEDLDKLFAAGIRRLKTAVSDNRAVALTKTKHAEQVIEGFKANISGLEARVKEAEDTLHNQNVVGQKMEESLRTEIDNLQRALKEKEESLQSRMSEVNDLRSKIDVLAEQVSQAELAVSKARGEAATKVQEAEQVIEGLQANIIVLEATLKAKLCQGEQNGVDSTDSSINVLDQDRNEPATDLDGHSQLQRNGRTASMAQAFANLQAQAVARITEAGRETVTPEAFVRIVTEFSKFANVIENIASLIVRDHVRTLGESMEQFPQKRLPELLESLSKEISDNTLKADFRARFGDKTLG
jgi:chromosome segregation ATPase